MQIVLSVFFSYKICQSLLLSIRICTVQTVLYSYLHRLLFLFPLDNFYQDLWCSCCEFNFSGKHDVWLCEVITLHYTTLHPFNGPFSGTTQVSQYQKGKTNLDFTEARDSEWQWHQLGHMQVCTSLQTDNHTSTPPLCFYRPGALPAAQPTASKH